MSVLTIHAHKRYAVRQPIWLRKADGLEVSGLLIELSSLGCRISNLGSAEFSTGDRVTIELEEVKLNGSVRWSRQGVAGVRLDVGLLPGQLSELITRARGEVTCYGT